MLRQSELPITEADVPVFDDDPALFDPSPEWFVPGLKPTLREHADDDGLGLRSLLERPAALSKAWRTTAQPRGRAHRAKHRHTGPPRASANAA